MCPLRLQLRQQNPPNPLRWQNRAPISRHQPRPRRPQPNQHAPRAQLRLQRPARRSHHRQQRLFRHQQRAHRGQGGAIVTDYIKNAIAEGQREVDAEEAARELERQREEAEERASFLRLLEDFPNELHEYASLGETVKYSGKDLIFTLPDCVPFAAWKPDRGGFGFRFKSQFGWDQSVNFCSLERAIWIANQNWLSRPTQQFNEAED